MIENTNGDIFPEGEYDFVVSSVPQKDYFKTSQKPYYKFEFVTSINGQREVYKEDFPVWLAAPLFRALGCAEEKPGIFDVNPPMFLGVKIHANIAHEIITKGNSAGKTVPRMKYPVALPKETEIAF